MFTDLSDGAQITVSHDVLVDFSMGGNVRRRRRN